MRSTPQFAIVAALLVGACARPVVVRPAPDVPAPAVSGSPAIDPQALRADLEELSSDRFLGRAAGTVAERMSATFIAQRARAIGLEPAGDSGYLQRVPLIEERLTAASSFAVTRGGRTVALSLGGAVAPLISLGDGVFARQRAEGDVVFAGYGVRDPATGRDELAGLEVRNRVVVVVVGAPAGTDSATRTQLEGQEGLSLRLQRLIPMEPAAVVLLFGPGAGERLYGQFAPELMRSMSLAGRGAEPPPDAQRPVPMIVLGRLDQAAALLPAQWPRDTRAQALPARFVGRAVTERRPTTGYNVVAVLRGRDARLASTYVALGAHHDHIGVLAPTAGDSIANGADDDGSGTVALLGVARSLAVGTHPRRSVLFVWHTAEEKGLLGSRHFTTRPTVPIDSIVAMFNADMIGRDGASTEEGAIDARAGDRLFIVGPGAAPNNQSRALGALVDSVNAAMVRPFALDREWDTPTHPERIYYRSDHFNYAEKGVPVVFLTTGLHADYHRVDDEVGKISFEKLARVATLLRDAALAVGNRATRPR